MLKEIRKLFYLLPQNIVKEKPGHFCACLKKHLETKKIGHKIKHNLVIIIKMECVTSGRN